MRFPLIVAAMTTLVFCASACGATNTPRPATHRVTIEGAAFVPATLTVKAGDTVIWTNKDPYPHTVTATAKAFDSGTLGPDASWELTLAKPGELSYICDLHPTMKGTLQVE
jgi:plastocyanin